MEYKTIECNSLPGCVNDGLPDELDGCSSEMSSNWNWEFEMVSIVMIFDRILFSISKDDQSINQASKQLIWYL